MKLPPRQDWAWLAGQERARARKIEEDTFVLKTKHAAYLEYIAARLHSQHLARKLAELRNTLAEHGIDPDA